MEAKTTDEAAAAVSTPGGGLRTRWVELVFALLIATAGAVVMYDSARIGAQWGNDGPQAGYFPWLTGCALALPHPATHPPRPTAGSDSGP